MIARIMPYFVASSAFQLLQADHEILGYYLSPIPGDRNNNLSDSPDFKY